MARTAHIQTKHIVEYAKGDYFNHMSEAIYDWLTENGVWPLGAGEYGEGEDWEIAKKDLWKIPETAYRDLKNGDETVTEADLRAFVSELREAPTGNWAYVSWF